MSTTTQPPVDANDDAPSTLEGSLRLFYYLASDQMMIKDLISFPVDSNPSSPICQAITKYVRDTLQILRSTYKDTAESKEMEEADPTPLIDTAFWLQEGFKDLEGFLTVEKPIGFDSEEAMNLGYEKAVTAQAGVDAAMQRIKALYVEAMVVSFNEKYGRLAGFSPSSE